MSTDDAWKLVMVFVGGAVPWLEAVFVIPGGIIAGLPTVPVVICAAAGNLVTVALAAWCGAGIRDRWTRRRRRKDSQRHDATKLARKANSRARRRQRVEKAMNRGGMPLLALIAPAIGTQAVAAAVVALSVSATRSFLWVGASTILWSVAAAAATTGGFQVLGLND